MLTPWLKAQRVLLEAYLEKHGGNKSHAAKDLGISLRTVRNKIRTFEMTRWYRPDPRKSTASIQRTESRSETQ